MPALGSPAVTGGFSDYLSTKWQKVLVSRGKERVLLYVRAMRVENMDTNPFLAVKISGMGFMPVKAEGQQFIFDQPIPGGNFQVTATPYGMGFSVTFEMWRDDLYGVMNEQWADMRRSARYRQEVQGWAAFNNAFSVNTGYDNAPLIGSHLDLDGTTQANRPVPDVTFSQTAIQAAQLNFRLLNDERSRPIAAEPTRIVIHPTNVPLAREILASSGKAQTTDNDMNATLVDQLNYMPSRYLVRTQDWFMAFPIDESDLIFFWRDRPIPRHFDDPFTMDADFTLYQRLAQFVGDWRWIYGSTVGV